VKIEGKAPSPLTGEVSTDSRPPRPAAARPGDAGQSPSVDVHVSTLGSQLQALERQLGGGEVIDAAKVAEIRQAISEGRLQINPDVIADRLLQTVRELLRDSGGKR
jgi:negative regulator of flagellin synthesis FlgM